MTDNTEKTGSPVQNVPKGSPKAEVAKMEALKKLTTTEDTEKIVVGIVCVCVHVCGVCMWCVWCSCGCECVVFVCVCVRVRPCVRGECMVCVVCVCVRACVLCMTCVCSVNVLC